MQLSIHTGDPLQSSTDLLVVAVTTDTLFKNPIVQAIDKALDGNLKSAAKEQNFKGNAKENLTLHTLGKMKSKRVAIVGVGDAKKLRNTNLLELGAQTTRLARRVGAKTVLLVSPPQAQEVARAHHLIARGGLLATYQFNTYKSDKGRPHPLKKWLLQHQGKASVKLHNQLAEAKIVSEAVALGRDLINDSPLQLYPESFAQRATKVAKDHGLQIKVLKPTELKRRKMNLLLGVGAGSARLPRLVHLSYTPKESASKKNAKPLVLVGKGVTFDSGGLSLKPPAAMVDMKIDMGGAAAVLGTMQAIGQLKPAFPVHGILALAENMPSGDAIRPGDVITGASGRSVEINNTDAEGRLVLADALHYATQLKPARIIDLATLTGACVVALGPHTVGLFSNNEKLAQDLLDSSQRSCEHFWRMPLTEALKSQLKSDVADTKNTGERWGGAITAALFLREFIGQTPWAHLDIAGPVNSSRDTGPLSKGGTGVAIATLISLITGQ
jgi:leucyl aminopeptidase